MVLVASSSLIHAEVACVSLWDSLGAPPSPLLVSTVVAKLVDTGSLQTFSGEGDKLGESE